MNPDFRVLMLMLALSAGSRTRLSGGPPAGAWAIESGLPSSTAAAWSAERTGRTQPQEAEGQDVLASPPALVPPDPEPPPPRDRATESSPTSRRAATDRTLIVTSRPMDARAIAEIEEDLNVMARILEKTVGQQVKSIPLRKLGLVLESDGKRRAQAVYLDGYGALFLLRVGVPLVPPPQRERSEPEVPPARIWEQTRHELYGGDGPALAFASPSEPAAEYSRPLVAALRTQLLEALANVAHIRQVKPGEFVTVTLLGSPNESGRPGPAMTSATGAPGAPSRAFLPGNPLSQGLDASGFRAQSFSAQRFTGSASSGGGIFSGEMVSGGAFGAGGFGSSPEPRPGTTLTIRVTKADAVAFADGKLSLEEYERRAAIQSYVGNAASSDARGFATQLDPF